MIYSKISDIPERAPCVVVIGNFDGVHKGHRALLEKAQSIAKIQNLPLLVLTFEPHPRAVFRPDDAPFRLTPPDMKLEHISAIIDGDILACPFDWEISQYTPKEFINSVLIQGLSAAHVVVGYDFRFGHGRSGDVQNMRDAGLDVHTISGVGDEEGGQYASSKIRESLRAGDVERANRVLGWPWEIRGPVIHGDKRGRELGFPTANMALENILHPAYGVYAARVQIEGEDQWRESALNIGIRPMYEVSTALLEAHILDFKQDIYDRILRVRPIKYLRGEMKFDKVTDLIEQMHADCSLVQHYLR